MPLIVPSLGSLGQSPGHQAIVSLETLADAEDTRLLSSLGFRDMTVSLKSFLA